MPTYEIQQVAGVGLGSQNGRKIVRKSNGDYWCCYTRSDGTRDQIYSAYSTDDGVTWTEVQVSFVTAQSQSSPAIAIDSADNLHIVWNGRGWGDNPGSENVQYKKRTTFWGSQEAITDETNYQRTASISIDSSDIPHVVWRGSFDDGGNPDFIRIQYSNRSGGSWSNAEDIGEGETVKEDQDLPDLEVDSSNTIHIIWAGTGHGTYPTKSQILYRDGTSGSWGTKELVTDIDAGQTSMSIVVDTNGDIHLVWKGKGWGNNTTKDNIQYRKRESGVWQTQEAITDTSTENINPTISIDTSDNLYAVWNDAAADQKIRFAKRTTAWSGASILVERAGYDQEKPSLIRAFHPLYQGTPTAGYVFVWAGEVAAGDTIEFYESSDVGWVPTYPSDPLLRVSGIRRTFWSGLGGQAVYQCELALGGMSITYVSPIGDRDIPSAVTPLTTVAKTTFTPSGEGYRLRDYGVWLSGTTVDIQTRLFGHSPPTYTEWVDWMEAVSKQGYAEWSY